jgi:hypothetical protein
LRPGRGGMNCLGLSLIARVSPDFLRKRLRRAVLTYVGAGCDCERSCP